MLVCASIVADHDRTLLAGPVAKLIPDGGPRPEKVSRIKAKVRDGFADLVAFATRPGRRPAPPSDRAPLFGEILAVATRLLTIAGVPGGALSRTRSSVRSTDSTSSTV